MANTQNIRGYVLNLPGGKAPWGTVEYTLLSNAISKLPDLTKYITIQHLHTQLYDPNVDTATGTPRATASSSGLQIPDYLMVGTTNGMGKVDVRHDINTESTVTTDKGINLAVGLGAAMAGTFTRDLTYRNIMLSDSGTLTSDGTLPIAFVTRGSNSEGLMGFGCVGLGIGMCASAIFRFVGGAGGTGTVTLVSADANFQASDAGPGGNRLCIYFVAGSNRQLVLQNRYGVTHKVSYWIFYNTGNLS